MASLHLFPQPVGRWNPDLPVHHPVAIPSEATSLQLTAFSTFLINRLLFTTSSHTDPTHFFISP
ncbi:hypothetical protein MPNT_460011 [Candidatus Methylacidithermus pantelleriae]|uniref:Uncharacterized protein n=1 Tax=Candidatus Methylacidithermus pantelleriae TaxID=2744239 RepID=A0A8J2FTE2_9BACT|nr:hypothetical protein MPNT_460011 [Candidatus Methylacidithermus pantelleriae]